MRCSFITVAFAYLATAAPLMELVDYEAFAPDDRYRYLPTSYKHEDIENAHNVFLRTGQIQYGDFYFNSNPKVKKFGSNLPKWKVKPPTDEEDGIECKGNKDAPETARVWYWAHLFDSMPGDMWCGQPHVKEGKWKHSEKMMKKVGGTVWIHGFEGRMKCNDVGPRLRDIIRKCHRMVNEDDKWYNRTNAVAFIANRPMTFTWLSVKS